MSSWRLLLAVTAAAPPSARGYTVGIIGGGTVGGGLARLLEDRRAALEAAAGTTLDLKAICVRDVAKTRDWELPKGCALVDDASKIAGNKDFDLVVELAGGVGDAKDVVMGAIAAGQDVVTANKALIAKHMSEIEELLNKNQGRFGFEAAVMGGIPIIHSLQNDFVGDTITSLQGIMNGCTNFMLTKMAATGCSYSDILGEAQQLGYAEADPSLDVGGQDARSKLKILMKLAFGLDVPEANIPCAGITCLKPVDFSYAKLMGGTIKLVGKAELVGGDTVNAFVAPTFVPLSQTLAAIGGATNAIEVDSANLGQTLLVGQGAGRYPTANSVVNDVVRCAARSCRKADSLGRAGVVKGQGPRFDPDFECGFYLRCEYADQVGIVRELGASCEAHGVSIFCMEQLVGVGAFVVVTNKVKASALKAVADELGKKPWATSTPFWMPVMGSPS